MKVKGIFMSWLVVKEIEPAVKFYTEVVGLTLKELNKHYGWAELAGPDGTMLGLAQENADFSMKAGTNAVTTVTVDNIQKGREHLQKKGAKVIGEIQEVPGEVKMQTFLDADGNMLQLVEMIK
jgi:predicted enzyme related to lactoylglutathione lyase